MIGYPIIVVGMAFANFASLDDADLDGFQPGHLVAKARSRANVPLRMTWLDRGPIYSPEQCQGVSSSAARGGIVAYHLTKKLRRFGLGHIVNSKKHQGDK